ncbi:glutathione S-transferase [Methylophilaceae bacterium]|nr:glutathione S-transferase [Methylophilaceae bacterium]
MKPVLYSYRRCPYAMRARMALRYAGIEVEIREISLKDKPRHILQCSPKGTVPVLVLHDGTVVDESLDIMEWALAQHDPDGWRRDIGLAMPLITENDGSFKRALDRYKYAVRFPEQPAETYRKEGERFLATLEARLSGHRYLLGDVLHQADVAIFPFVRQFSMVDADWFAASAYPALRSWLHGLVDSELFTGAMQKYPAWVESPEPGNQLA